jgi:hypothetical protein
MNFDLLNTTCQKAILISENFCLDKSFDIIKQNFDVFAKDLGMSDDQFQRFEILLDRYEKNKNKYRKFLTFVSQFSASLEDVQRTYNRYKNIWSIVSTPMEIIYPTILPVEKWGSFNVKTGIINENFSISNTEVTKIENWVNNKFPEQEYGIYKNISIRVYFYFEKPVSYKMSASFIEKCYAGGGSSKVCCTGCSNFGGYAGCNRPGPGGNICGNMYDWCPAPYYNSTNCNTGSCKGWEKGQDKKTWKEKKLAISREIIFPNDKFFIGYQILRLQINNNNVWKRV